MIAKKLVRGLEGKLNFVLAADMEARGLDFPVVNVHVLNVLQYTIRQ